MSSLRQLFGFSGTLAVLAAVACASPEGQTSSPSAAPAASPAAAFVAIVGERVYFQALMRGATLVVTDGCVCATLPPDSPELSLKYRLAFSEGATMDGESVSIPEGGQVRIGDTVDIGGGGIFDLESPPMNLRVPVACDLDLPIWAVTSLEIA
ncbi:hypothetical protein AB0M79_02865 [Polymorphospora sp. NPDC051019]|uniref:hypothetical protein n=1 Tax=Polymorphospora sp. NPDC051019 TaxID=3155725 RepID=UPI0034182D92